MFLSHPSCILFSTNPLIYVLSHPSFIIFSLLAPDNQTDVEMIVFLAIMLHKAPASFGLVTYLLHEGLERSRIRQFITYPQRGVGSGSLSHTLREEQDQVVSYIPSPLGTSEEQDQVVNHILTPLGIREENDQVVGQMPTPGGIREEQYQVVGYIPSPLGIREEQDQVVSYIPSPLGIREENDQVVGHMLLQEGLESGSWLYTFYTRDQ